MNKMERFEHSAHQRVLVIDDDPGLSECIECLLRTQGYDAVMVATTEEGRKAVASDEYDLIVTDLKLPDGSGLEVLRHVKKLDGEAPVILMTSYSSMESAIEALRLGAVDYMIKPFDNVDFVHAVQRALDERRIKRENRILKRNLKQAYSKELVGESPPMRRVVGMIERIAPSDAQVLIEGESGTGKELAARAIHDASARANGPFVAINCGAIPAELMESELFGHVKGAYTGATSSHEGLIREANGGTLLLDEISELPLNLQVKLLRALQQSEVRPIGGNRAYQVDVRFLAASNYDLRRAVEEGTFREDLFFRLNVINIRLPSLRERGDDIQLLAKRFIEHYSRKMGKEIRGIDERFERFLRDYHWPGNVRELENLIERAVILADSDVLTTTYLTDVENTRPPRSERPAGAGDTDLLEGPVSVEEYIQEVVKRYQDRYNETELAKLLGIGRKALWMRRRKWGLYRSGRPNRRHEAEVGIAPDEALREGDGWA